MISTKKYNLSLYLDPKEIDILYTYAINNYHSSKFVKNPFGKGRYYTCLDKVDTPVSSLVRQIYHKTFEKLCICNYYIEPLFGMFLGINENGAYVQIHTDPSPPDKEHVRINFLIKKPLLGGIPIINNECINIQQGQGWLNIASAWKHGSSPVISNEPRVLLSLGAIINKNEKLLANYLSDITCPEVFNYT